MEWLSQANYLGAFLVGLFGGVHCLGMCGGIVTALSFNVKTSGNNVAYSGANNVSISPATSLASSHSKPSSALNILLGYNLGRLLSYTFAGALAGGIGAMSIYGVDTLTQIQSSRNVLSIVASLFMMALGLYLAGIWRGIAYLERVGRHLWKVIEPVSRQFIPARHFYQALPLGMLWGWLPCGLVYTILIWTLSSGSAFEGALLMLAFGLGTLPNLLAMGLAAQKLSRLTQIPWVRYIAGGLVVVMGLVMLMSQLKLYL